MPITKRKDLVIPEIMEQAMQAAFEGMTALWGTDVAVVNGSLPSTNVGGAKLKGGDEITVPYFNALGELEDLDEGQAAKPERLTMSDEKARVVRSSKAVEITEWAQLAAQYADPYAEFARQLRELVKRRADKALIDAAGHNLPQQMIKDVTGGAQPVKLDWDIMVDAKMIWGDEQDDILLMTVHSKVLGDLQKLKDNAGRPLLVDVREGASGRWMFNGVPVRVSDRNTVVPASGNQPAKYKSRILKRNALAFWYNKGPSFAIDEDILTDSTIAATHVYWVAHRYKRVPGGTKPGAVEIITN